MSLVDDPTDLDRGGTETALAGEEQRTPQQIPLWYAVARAARHTTSMQILVLRIKDIF